MRRRVQGCTGPRDLGMVRCSAVKIDQDFTKTPCLSPCCHATVAGPSPYRPLEVSGLQCPWLVQECRPTKSRTCGHSGWLCFSR